MGDGRHFMPNVNAITANWFWRTSRTETLWQRHQITPKHQRDELRATTVTYYDEESACVTMVNANMVAMFTNRPLEWNNASCSRAFRGVTANILYNPNNSEGKVLMNVDGRYNVPLLTLAELDELGFLKTSESKCMAKELFSEGDDFLYGMLLHNLLEWPTLPALPTKIFDSSESTVFAVRDDPFTEADDDLLMIDTCMIRLQDAARSIDIAATTKPSLPCVVFFQRARKPVEFESANSMQLYHHFSYYISRRFFGLHGTGCRNGLQWIHGAPLVHSTT
jgi:hypothetical protein